MDDEPMGDRVADRNRPRTESSYGIPSHQEGLLEWSFVEETMAAERFYWVITVRPDGHPHARPTWGVWVNGTFHCGGGEKTHWVRNLTADPRITVHTESAESVVIIEGWADRLARETTEASTLERLDDAYEAKYEIRHGPPLFAVHPETVHAWSEFPADATRWQF